MMDPDKVSVTQNVDGYHHKIVGGNIIHGDAYFTVQGDNLGVVTVAIGPHYTCAICDDGTVWTWGRATRGQLGRNPEPQEQVMLVLLVILYLQ